MEDQKACDTFITIQVAADILSCTPQFIYTLIGSGDLKAIKLGSRALRISVESLHNFIDNNWVDPETYRVEEDEKKPPKRGGTVKTGVRSDFMSR